MTDQLLELKIQELEEEVKRLKQMIPEEKQPKRSLCPKEVAEKHGGLMKKGIAWEYNHFPFMNFNDLTALSRVIRRCCFLRTDKDKTIVSADNHSYRARTLKCDYGKTLKELTDDEYARYSEIMDKVLDIFQEYGCMENDNW